ncbi:leucine-rich repeat-containing protein 25 isoform X2 [Ambystoma mexicanum]|uniref:leucine-rich repeat-containing protein 25 isoform X2 n=1 Tax=Ambystoma mexicanum TaxID=8296 RepID=UPI0037E99382
MKAIVALVFILCNIPLTSGNCFNDNFSCQTSNLSNIRNNCSILHWSEFDTCKTISKLILSHNNIKQIEEHPGSGNTKLSYLDLSFNELQRLPKGFLSQAGELEVLNLANNKLIELPGDFLGASNKLQILNLEDNPITNVPSTVMKRSLVKLTVDCRCDIAWNIMDKYSQAQLNGTSHEYSNSSFRCKHENNWFDIKDFYSQKCQNSALLAVYICVPLVVGIIAGIAIYFGVRRNRMATDFQMKPDSDKSPTHTQPRYTSRNMESLSKEGSSQFQNQAMPYENVFVGPLHASPVGQYECLDRAQDLRRNQDE